VTALAQSKVHKKCSLVEVQAPRDECIYREIAKALEQVLLTRRNKHGTLSEWEI
jgi:hypothetical protein